MRGITKVVWAWMDRGRSSNASGTRRLATLADEYDSDNPMHSVSGVESIECGPVELVLRCTKGVFQGRFIYVNRTRPGELLGSDRDSPDITMYIENCNLSRKHATIQCVQSGPEYFLRDTCSQDGTYVLCEALHPIRLLPGHELLFGRYTYRVSMGSALTPAELFDCWLQNHALDHIKDLFSRFKIESVDTARAFFESWDVRFPSPTPQESRGRATVIRSGSTDDTHSTAHTTREEQPGEMGDSPNSDAQANLDRVTATSASGGDQAEEKREGCRGAFLPSEPAPEPLHAHSKLEDAVRIPRSLIGRFLDQLTPADRGCLRVALADARGYSSVTAAEAAAAKPDSIRKSGLTTSGLSRESVDDSQRPMSQCRRLVLDLLAEGSSESHTITPVGATVGGTSSTPDSPPEWKRTCYPPLVHPVSPRLLARSRSHSDNVNRSSDVNAMRGESYTRKSSVEASHQSRLSTAACSMTQNDHLTFWGPKPRLTSQRIDYEHWNEPFGGWEQSEPPEPENAAAEGIAYLARIRHFLSSKAPREQLVISDEKLCPKAFRLTYQDGFYLLSSFLHPPAIESKTTSPRCWVRLSPGQYHLLSPGSSFAMGTLEFQVARFNTGLWSAIGQRATMEDEEVVIQDLDVSTHRLMSFYGVYDGHGGRGCAEWVRDSLHVFFRDAILRRGGLDGATNVRRLITESMHDAFAATDSSFLCAVHDGYLKTGAGCAAVVLVIVGAEIWCANVGDSRAVLCRGGVAVDLSDDHKPDRADEMLRIQQAGGFVYLRRVVGRLAVSRAFGDYEYKCLAPPDPTDPSSLQQGRSSPYVISVPEIRRETLSGEDDFLLVACDGLFDVFTSQDAIDFCRSRLAAMPKSEQDPGLVARELVAEALQKRFSRDNVTAVIATLKRCVTT